MIGSEQSNVRQNHSLSHYINNDTHHQYRMYCMWSDCIVCIHIIVCFSNDQVIPVFGLKHSFGRTSEYMSQNTKKNQLYAVNDLSSPTCYISPFVILTFAILYVSVCVFLFLLRFLPRLRFKTN